MRQTHCRLWNMVKNTVKCRKCEMHTVGAGIWQNKTKQKQKQKKKKRKTEKSGK